MQETQPRSQPSSHSHASAHLRTRPPRQRTISEHEQLVNAQADHFYYGEQATLISNGLSTDLLVFPSDLAAGREADLAKKIDSAIHYATTFSDVEELNAIRYMAPKKNRSDYAAMGLYLYLADECSRLHCKTSFLTALRREHVGLKDGESFKQAALQEKFMSALHKLGMDKSHGHIVEEWVNTGGFTIKGDPARNVQDDWNGSDEKKNVLNGAYASLAYQIGWKEPIFGLNNAVSYALANRRTMENQADGVEALAYTRTLTPNNNPPGVLNPHVAQCIANGDKKRHDRIRDIIHERLKAPQEDAPWQLQKALARRMALDVLQSMPDAPLKILTSQDYTLVYTNSGDIRNCYPQEDMPGVSHKSNEISRDSKALRNNRYRVIYFSNGWRNHPEDMENHDLRNMVFKQSLMHELFHVALSTLDDHAIGVENKKETWEIIKAVNAVHDELEAKKDSLPAYFHANLKTMDGRTLAEVMNCNSEMYEKYSLDERRMEVACNLYGFLHTEFPRDAQGNNPCNESPAMAALADKIEATVNLALERITAQGQKQGNGGKSGAALC